MIEVKNLIYKYSKKEVLKGIDLTLPESSISALVGSNGAGKSTLLECIAGIRIPHSGKIWINGIDIIEKPRSCNSLIGFLPTFYGLYDEFTVKQNLRFFAESHKIPHRLISTRIEEVSEMIALTQQLDYRISDLSRGLRQRVAIAQAIIHKPSVLLLEKPSTGLDHQSLKALKKTLIHFKEQGATIIVISQLCDEFIVSSDHLLFLKNGNLVFTPNKDDNYAVYMLSIEGNMSECIIKMNEYKGVRILKNIDKTSIYITFESQTINLSDFLKFLIINNIKVTEFHQSKTWLEMLCNELK